MAIVFGRQLRFAEKVFAHRSDEGRRGVLLDLVRMVFAGADQAQEVVAALDHGVWAIQPGESPLL